MSSATIVLIGPMGAGKSTIGKALSDLLDLPFCDTDAEISAQTRMSITEIFTQKGEEHFRALEREIVSTCLSQTGVISLGGGAVLDPETQSDLENLPVVFIDTTLAIVAPRIFGTDSRPLLAISPRKTWQDMYEVRRPIYARLADHEILPRELSPQQAAQKIAKMLKLSLADSDNAVQAGQSK